MMIKFLLFLGGFSFWSHQTRLGESFRLHPWDPSLGNHSGRDPSFSDL